MSPTPSRQVSCPRCGESAKVYPTLPTHVHCMLCGLVPLKPAVVPALVA